MRTPLLVLAVFVMVCGAPMVLGGIVLTTLAATLAAAQPRTSPSACAIAPFHPVTGSAVARRIDTWIVRTVPASPLIGLGQAMVDGAAGSGLDPRLLAAIALQETRLGTLGAGPAVHNPFGLGPGLVFGSWSSAIALAVHTLEAMHAGGAQTIDGIAAHWAPIGAGNDPTNLNANWAGGVAAGYVQLGGDAAASVFGPQSTGPSSPVTPCSPTMTPAGGRRAR